MENCQLYPVFLKLRDKAVLIVGGGNLALQKLHTFRETGARVTVVATRMLPGLLEEVPGVRRTLMRRPYNPRDLEGKQLVYAATDDQALNRRICREAGRAGIWVNAVDDPEPCEFYTPAVLRRGEITLALSTSGRFPGISKALRETLEAWLPSRDDGLLRDLFSLRDALRKSNLAGAARSHALRALVNRFRKEYLEPVGETEAADVKP